MTGRKTLCLTLDLEDDWQLDDPTLDHLAVVEHLEEFVRLIETIDVPLSVFVVGQTLEKHPEKVDQLRSELDCEFHLHSYQHDITKSYDFETEVRRGMAAYRDFFGRDPVGYRAPQGNIESHEFGILEELGFDFDSSIFPTYRPGTFNNIRAPQEPYIPPGVSSLLEIPFGSFRWIRIPTSLSYFKLFGRPLAELLSIAPLPEVLVYNVHLHDFYRTASYDAVEVSKRWMANRNLERAESLFLDTIETIRERGYEPVMTTTVYKETTNRESSVATMDRRIGPNIDG